MKPQIVFCVPGKQFSGNFLDSWTHLLVHCMNQKYDIALSRQESPVIYYVRNLCLGGDLTKGPDQLPFQNQLNYTHMMWIDSDMVFTPDQFMRLLEHDQDIVAGVYKTKSGMNFAAVEHWDEEKFQRDGVFDFMTEESIAGRESLIDVAYTGFGFVLVKRGVFESLKYPWFRPLFHNINGLEDFSSEDVSFCLQIREKGFKIWVDPTIRVGHEKPCIL